MIVKSFELGIRGMGPVQIVPARDNDVPDEVWAQWKAHPDIAALLKAGKLVEVTEVQELPAPVEIEVKPKSGLLAAMGK